MTRFLPKIAFTVCVLLFRLPVLAQDPDSVKDRKEIEASVSRYEAAWNRHDPEALAAEYQPDATWVNWFGSIWKGRTEIEGHYKQVHSTYFKTTHYYIRSIEDILFVKPDVAVVHVRTGLSGDARFPDKTFEFRRTVVFTKSGAQWKILAGQNAKLDDNIK